MSASPNIFEVDSSTCHVPDYVCMMLAVKEVPRTCYVGPVVVRDGGGGGTSSGLAGVIGDAQSMAHEKLQKVFKFSRGAKTPKTKGTDIW